MTPQLVVAAVAVSLVRAPFAAAAPADLQARCAQFTEVPTDARDDVLAWNQALSLAGCLQDNAIAEVTDEDELRGVVGTMFERLQAVVAIYAMALREGPEDVRVRAAYQMGMLFATAATRARSSIRVAPGPDAIRRNLALHAALEPRLAPVIRTAETIFEAIDEEATREPALESDPVIGGMIRTARAMRRNPCEPAPEPEPDDLIRLLR
jgi:hypothetical protein